MPTELDTGGLAVLERFWAEGWTPARGGTASVATPGSAGRVLAPSWALKRGQTYSMALTRFGAYRLMLYGCMDC